MRFSFLFTAEFEDGHIIEQTEQDVSTIDPERSAFYDVLSYPSPLVRFTLGGDGVSYGVDLTTGHFILDGVREIRPFHPSELPFVNMQIFYARTVQQKLEVTSKVNDKHESEITGIAPQEGHIVFYYLGWTATSHGKEVRHIITIDA
jgi:hypothetical protein